MNVQNAERARIATLCAAYAAALTEFQVKESAYEKLCREQAEGSGFPEESEEWQHAYIDAAEDLARDGFGPLSELRELNRTEEELLGQFYSAISRYARPTERVFMVQVHGKLHLIPIRRRVLRMAFQWANKANILPQELREA